MRMGEGMPKVSKNLSLDREVVARAERYAELHRTSISRLVGDYLEWLTRGGESEGEREFSPKVGRLVGIARREGEAPPEDPVAEYHRYLERKYL